MGKKRLATTDRGGGKKGMSERAGGKTGGARFQCYVCFSNVPDEKSMRIHFENKHEKLVFDMEKCKQNEVRKNVDAARMRIRQSGPQLSAGKNMKKKKEERIITLIY